MTLGGSRLPREPCTVVPTWCIFIDPAHPLAIAVTPATRSAPVFTSLWQLANDASRFQVTLSDSGLSGSLGPEGSAGFLAAAAGGSAMAPPVGVAGAGAAPPPPPHARPTSGARA